MGIFCLKVFGRKKETKERSGSSVVTASGLSLPPAPPNLPTQPPSEGLPSKPPSKESGGIAGTFLGGISMVLKVVGDLGAIAGPPALAVHGLSVGVELGMVNVSFLSVAETLSCYHRRYIKIRLIERSLRKMWSEFWRELKDWKETISCQSR